MANPDSHTTAGAPPASSDTVGKSPQIVPITSTFDLMAFPSELEQVADVDARPSIEPAGGHEPIVSTFAAPADRSAHEAAGAVSFSVASDAPKRHSPGATEAGSVLEFAPRPPDASGDAIASAFSPDGHTSLAGLIERPGGLGWREAVSIVSALCLKLQDPAQAPVQLDPRLIQVTPTGEVSLLPGQPGGDPLVVQVGRLLRILLAGKDGPPELRLLLSQVTFELPILKSVEDVSRALQHIQALDQTRGPGTAVIRAPQPPRPGAPDKAPRALRSMMPPPVRRDRGAYRVRVWLNLDGVLIGAILLAALVIAGLVLGQSSTLGRPGPPAGAAASTRGAVQTAVDPPPLADAPTNGPSAPTHSNTPLGPLSTSGPGEQNPAGAAQMRYRSERAPVSTPTSGVSKAARAADNVPVESPRESQRRAAALVAEGHIQEAAKVFDSLIQASPLYEPRPTDLTPEALAAFRNVRRQLLPSIAIRDYDRAKTALTAGDPDRALALGNQVTAILDRLESDPLPALRRNAQELVEQATAAKTQADEIIYTRADAGVVPPRLLGRGFPVKGPLDVPPNRVGVLEMVIGRLGDVEDIRLHTPLNRYHERMIVSAAKAWRYRPATKDGKPVRFRLTVKINLPESGTDPF